MQNHQEIIVVTGLPRSGTSLCMRMLESGGIQALTDGARTADDDNPNGYYEFEAVKRTRDDPSWLANSVGKAVKMVYRLVYDLPVSHRYAVLFMRRDMDEVLESQRVMLTRNNISSRHDDRAIKELFEREMRDFKTWLGHSPHLRSLEVDFNKMMREAAPVVAEVNGFLDGALVERSMLQVVDPALYRNRKKVCVQS